jgi:hypothetical protein
MFHSETTAAISGIRTALDGIEVRSDTALIRAELGLALCAVMEYRDVEAYGLACRYRKEIRKGIKEFRKARDLIEAHEAIDLIETPIIRLLDI